MKIRLLIVLTAVALAGGSALVVMNNDCKSSRHSWCSPDIPHHAKTSHS
jgi:hypothetical protein